MAVTGTFRFHPVGQGLFYSGLINAAPAKRNGVFSFVYDCGSASPRRFQKGILQDVSERLQQEFGTGFSVRNLQQMKKFYVMFPNTNALRSQLTWTHYRALFTHRG